MSPLVTKLLLPLFCITVLVDAPLSPAMNGRLLLLIMPLLLMTPLAVTRGMPPLMGKTPPFVLVKGKPLICVLVMIPA